MKKLLISLLAVLCMVPTLPVAAASVKINSTNFPDKNFRKVVKNEFDDNDDGYLSSDEIKYATYLYAYDQNIESAEGIKYLKNLTTLYLSDNPLESLDLYYNTKIENLDVSGTPLKTIKNIKKLADLETLVCSQTLLYNQNLENVLASTIEVDYSEYYYVPNGKFSLNVINSKWDKARVTVKEGATKDGTQLKGFDSYGDVILRYKRKDGGSTAIEIRYDRMDTPEIWNIDGLTYNSIELQWYGDSSIEYYEVYRSTSKSGTYSKIKVTKDREYVNKSVTTGKYYYYKVRGYHKVNGIKVYSKFSPIEVKKAKLDQVSGMDVVDHENKQYTLKWDKVAGATGYQIYRATKSNGTYKKVATVSTNYKKFSYTTKFDYYYKVRAYRKVGSNNVTGNFSYIYNVWVF